MTRAALALAAAMWAAPAAAQPAELREVPAGEAAAARDARAAATTDRRPIYVVAGIAVLAAVFLWNRRNRAALDRASDQAARDAKLRARRARAVTPDDGVATAATGFAAADAPDAANAADPDAEPGDAATDDEDADAADLRAAAAAPIHEEPK